MCNVETCDLPICWKKLTRALENAPDCKYSNKGKVLIKWKNQPVCFGLHTTFSVHFCELKLLGGTLSETRSALKDQ